MIRSVYKYNFSKLIPMNDIADSLMLAALAAESLHGRSEMKMDAAFCLNTRTRTCVIDAETQVGCDIARMFTGFITKGFGEQSFSVERTEDRIRCNAAGLNAVGVTA